MLLLEDALQANTAALGGVAEDLKALRAPERRPQLAARLGAAFAGGELNPAERLVVIEIFKCLARDTAVEVRAALAEHVKHSPLLPQSLAMKLAQDIESVALPILQHSTVLTDDDLTTIIGDGSTAKQRAIAQRETLSDTVSLALIDAGDKGVIETLLANPGAEISEASYHSLLNAFADDTDIQEGLVDRAALPFEIQERLIALVSDELRARLVAEHDFPEVLAEQLAQQGREGAICRSLATLRTPQEIEAAAMRLYLKGALTPTLLLRALSAGRLEFFGAALATLGRLPSQKAQEALRKAGTPALRSLYEKSRLPQHLQKAFQVILEVVLAGGRGERKLPQAEIEERIVHQLVRAYRDVSPDSLENVICRLGRAQGNS